MFKGSLIEQLPCVKHVLPLMEDQVSSKLSVLVNTRPLWATRDSSRLKGMQTGSSCLADVMGTAVSMPCTLA